MITLWRHQTWLAARTKKNSSMIFPLKPPFMENMTAYHLDISP